MVFVKEVVFVVAEAKPAIIISFNFVRINIYNKLVFLRNLYFL